ncbi:gliding motility protein [Streptomyces sp. NPDC029003]|uniref:gliding motility protein n=1 Tax=Streptomyces sp. NPDC029003 TaxID=3155125 RepID=UPI0033E07A55
MAEEAAASTLKAEPESAAEEAGADAGPEPSAAEAGAVEAVEIPKQQSAEAAADSETGEGALK